MNSHTIISTQSALLSALGQAAYVSLSAYVLQAGSPVVRALEAAADRGASVDVTLEGAPYAGRSGSGDLAQVNARIAASLAQHGVRVRLVGPEAASLHLKAAVVDHEVFLDDRNWPAGGGDTLVASDDPAIRAAVLAAFGGTTVAGATFATDKAAALRLEANAIAQGRGDRIDVESESFGSSAVTTALAARAAAGAHVRLLVSGREFYARSSGPERAALTRLAKAGAEVRISGNEEKLCVAGDRAWVGSANATGSPTPVVDWGMRLDDPLPVAAIEAAFQRNWEAARVPRAFAPSPASAPRPGLA